MAKHNGLENFIGKSSNEHPRIRAFLRPEEQEIIARYYNLPPAAVYIPEKEKCKYPVEWFEEGDKE